MKKGGNNTIWRVEDEQHIKRIGNNNQNQTGEKKVRATGIELGRDGFKKIHDTRGFS